MTDFKQPDTPASETGQSSHQGLQWNPRDDITTHELAIAVPILAENANRRTPQFKIAAWVAALPENVKRHFRAS